MWQDFIQPGIIPYSSVFISIFDWYTNKEFPTTIRETYGQNIVMETSPINFWKSIDLGENDLIK